MARLKYWSQLNKAGKVGIASVVMAVVVSTIGTAIAVATSEPPGPDSAQYKTMDEKLSDIGNAVPEFGGMHVVEEGVLEVYVTNLEGADKEQVREALKHTLGSDLVSRYEIRLTEGEYSMSQLTAWYEVAGGPILRTPGVRRTGIKEGKNRLNVTVKDDETKAIVENKLRDLGVPLEAVIINVVPGKQVLFSTLTDRFDPLDASGVRIENDNGNGCTLGFITKRDNTLGFVTNSHCTVTDFAPDNGDFHQPDAQSDDSDLIGNEVTDPTWSAVTESSCPGNECRMSDSAFIDIDTSTRTDFTRGLIARPVPGSLTIDSSNPRFRIIDESITLETDTVHKVGEDTGWTSGPILDTCENIPYQSTGNYLLCQDITLLNLNGGDSGAPVFRKVDTPQEGDVEILGIIWGGVVNPSTGEILEVYYSPIGNVFADLGSTVSWDTCHENFSC